MEEPIPITIYEITSHSLVFTQKEADDARGGKRFRIATGIDGEPQARLNIVVCVGPIWQSGRYQVVFEEEREVLARSPVIDVHEAAARSGAQYEIPRFAVPFCTTGVLRCIRLGDLETRP